MGDKKKIIVACPHGFCAGVDRAIRMMELALEKFGAPVYCLNEIVHNPMVVDGFAAKGVKFVKGLNDVPTGSVVLFSAHGVAPSVRAHAEERHLKVVDATCPFVEKIHREVRRWAAAGKRVFLVGHKTHEEIIGISGEAPESVTVVQDADEGEAVRHDDGSGVAVATQTTLCLEEAERVIAVLERKYPGLERPSRGDICYATLNRQKAVRALASEVDVVLVIGSRNSSNTNRLVEVAESEGVAATLVDQLTALDDVEFGNVDSVGITSGASTPENFTEQVIAVLVERGYSTVERLEVVKEDSGTAGSEDMKEYERLEAEDGMFPKVCGKCKCTYPDLKSFCEETEPVAKDTGLAEFPADEVSNIVGVFRNCPCGSTLLIACHDRRDMTEAGEERRKNFDNVLDCLEALGIERELARKELRRFVNGESSEVLESAGLRR